MNFEDDKFLYPELPEEGKVKAEEIIQRIKKNVLKEIENGLGDMYSEIIPYIESDSWANYRNQMISGMTGYRTAIHKNDWKGIRAKILEEHREEIINDLNQDHLNKIKELQDHLQELRSKGY